jgi:hypothetical protein
MAETLQQLLRGRAEQDTGTCLVPVAPGIRNSCPRRRV